MQGDKVIAEAPLPGINLFKICLFYSLATPIHTIIFAIKRWYAGVQFEFLLYQSEKKADVTEMAKPCTMNNHVNRKWFAIYTRPRWEKKVNRLLQEKGIESYCPLNKVRRKWSDRVKTIEEPLFKSYVFVKVGDEEKTTVRMTVGVMNFVYWNKKPAIIKEKEILTIKRFLDEYKDVHVFPMELKLNDRVRVTSGSFMDREGQVLGLRHKIVKVAIDSLGYILVAYIERSKLISVQSK